jgi:hypothetical protein
MDIISGKNNVFGIVGIDEKGESYWLFRARVIPSISLDSENAGGRVLKNNLDKEYTLREVFTPRSAPKPEDTEDSITCTKIVVGKDGIVTVSLDRLAPHGRLSHPQIRVQESAAEISANIDEMKKIMDKKKYSKRAPQPPEVIIYKDPRIVVSEETYG